MNTIRVQVEILVPASSISAAVERIERAINATNENRPGGWDHLTVTSIHGDVVKKK